MQWFLMLRCTNTILFEPPGKFTLKDGVQVPVIFGGPYIESAAKNSPVKYMDSFNAFIGPYEFYLLSELEVSFR